MEGTIHLEVATPKGLVLQTQCHGVSGPSVAGEFGVLPGHIPLLAALRSGLLRYTLENEEHAAAVGPGFVEVGPDRVLVLTDMFAVHKDVDEESVREELEEAERLMAEHSGNYGSHDFVEAERAMEWARARLDLLDATEA